MIREKDKDIFKAVSGKELKCSFCGEDADSHYSLEVFCCVDCARDNLAMLLADSILNADNHKEGFAIIENLEGELKKHEAKFWRAVSCALANKL